MLIVLEKTHLSQKRIPVDFSLYTGCQTSLSDKKGLEALKAVHFTPPPFFFTPKMQCFVLTSTGKEMKGSVIKPKGLSVVIKWPFTPDL